MLKKAKVGDRIRVTCVMYKYDNYDVGDVLTVKEVRPHGVYVEEIPNLLLHEAYLIISDEAEYVCVSWEVYDALRNVVGSSLAEIQSAYDKHASGNPSRNPQHRNLNTLFDAGFTPRKIFDTLESGYYPKREPTPEDRLVEEYHKEVYHATIFGGGLASFHRGVALGMKKAARILGSDAFKTGGDE